MKWISVKDRLPEDGQYVRVKGIPDTKTKPIEIEIYYFDNLGFISNITHWKPAEPPTEGE